MAFGALRQAALQSRTARNLRRFSQILSPGRLAAGTACLATGALLASVGAYSLTAPKVSKLETLKDLRAEIKRMEHLLAEGGDTSVVHSPLVLSEALANAIQYGDASSFREMIHAYLEETHPNHDYLDAIINLCASQGKVSLLRILMNEFSFEARVLYHPDALQLINHPMADDIERFAAEFIHGVGSIKKSGAQAKIAHYKAEALSDDLSSISPPDVTGMDLIEDMSLSLGFIKSQYQVAKDINDRFKNVVALDALDTSATHQYLQILKTQSQQSDKPIQSIFIACDNHFTVGQLRVSEQGKKVELMYLDSLGGLESSNPAINVIIQDIEHIFRGAQKNYFISEANTQHANKGCSVFSLMQVEDLLFLDQTLAHHPHYADQDIQNIFDYIYKNPETRTASGSEACYRPIDAEGNYEEQPIIIEWTTVLPPLAMVRAKQSFNTTGKKKAKDYGTDRDVVGYMGIEKALAHSPPSRQAEEHQPIDRHGKETFREWVTRNTGINKRGKPFNESTVLEIWRWGRDMTSWLMSLSPQEISDLKTAHTVESLAMPTQKSIFSNVSTLFKTEPKHIEKQKKGDTDLPTPSAS